METRGLFFYWYFHSFFVLLLGTRMQEDIGKDVVRFQTRRVIVNLFKDFLCILEDLDLDHTIALESLKKKFPEHAEQIDAADHFTDEKWEALRSRILGKGNDSIRELESHLDYFEIKIKEKNHD